MLHSVHCIIVKHLICNEYDYDDAIILSLYCCPQKVAEAIQSYIAMINSILFVVVFALAGLHLTECEVITSTVEASSGAGWNHGARPLTQSAHQGGRGGRPFDDIADHDLAPVPIVGVRSISISYKDKVDSLQRLFHSKFRSVTSQQMGELVAAVLRNCHQTGSLLRHRRCHPFSEV